MIDALADDKLRASLSRVRTFASDEDSDEVEVIEVSEEQKAAFIKLHRDMDRLSRRMKKAGWVKLEDEAAEGKARKAFKKAAKEGKSSAKKKGNDAAVEKESKKKNLEGMLIRMVASFALAFTVVSLKV